MGCGVLLVDRDAVGVFRGEIRCLIRSMSNFA